MIGRKKYPPGGRIGPGYPPGNLLFSDLVIRIFDNAVAFSTCCRMATRMSRDGQFTLAGTLGHTPRMLRYAITISDGAPARI